MSHQHNIRPRHFLHRALLTAALSTSLMSATAGATPINGIVAHRNSHARSFAVASSSGKMRAIHASRLPRVGKNVSVTVRKLRNGTLAAKETQTVDPKIRKKFKIRGTVTFADSVNQTFTVSDTGTSVLVHIVATPSSLSEGSSSSESAAPALPAVGDFVIVKVKIDSTTGDLNAAEITDLGQIAGVFELEGIILSVDTGAKTITVSGDDEGSDASAQVVVNIPDGLDMSLYVVGNSVELKVQKNLDGSFTLIHSSDNGNAHEANDPEHHQGTDDGESGSSSSSSSSSSSDDHHGGH